MGFNSGFKGLTHFTWHSGGLNSQQAESVEITNKMQLVIEFIIPKFIEG